MIRLTAAELPAQANPLSADAATVSDFPAWDASPLWEGWPGGLINELRG
jgi:hypothetical protein